MMSRLDERERGRRDVAARFWWYRAAEWLRYYSDERSASVFGGLCRYFDYREGRFVIARTGVLVVLLGVALHYPTVHACIATTAVFFAFYFVADALVANTSVVFVSGSLINPLRSVVLTLGTYFDLALGFAVGWVVLVHDDASYGLWERGTTAVYESLRTLATVGPERPPVWLAGKLLVMAELLVGIYFVAIIIAIYASWARTGHR
jgi:hypothetical protein